MGTDTMIPVPIDYDTCTRPVNMRVSKIPVPAGSGHSFLIFVSYPLRIFSTDTHFLTSLCIYINIF